MEDVRRQQDTKQPDYGSVEPQPHAEQNAAAEQMLAAAVLAPGPHVGTPATGSATSPEPLQGKQQQILVADVQKQPKAAHSAEGNSNQPAWQCYNSVFTAAKAGMQNVDKEKVKKVVYEMSKDSAHFKNEQRKQGQVDAKIAQLKAKAAALSPSELAGHQKLCDTKVTQLEATRDLTKTWLHVDMDAFYASVEELEQPALKSKPMAVGGMGMICTANYEARKYGVRSAMPGFIARKLCPQLVFVKPDFVKYTAASEQTRAVFRLYDPDFEAGSLDEAYLDVTTYCREHATTGEQVAAELRAKVTAATQLTCSVGVAPNVTLAKIASDMNKPNGQAVVTANRDAVMAFVHDLPIRKIPGIGKVSEQTLNALGINTCSEIIHQRALIAALLSPISCNFLLSVGLGLGATEHGSRDGGEDSSLPRRKGISCERTFSAMSAPAAMEQMADMLVQHLVSDMADEGIAAKTLTLKLKTTAFEVRTRAVTLPQHVSTVEQMLQPILKLLKAELPVEIRLMGVRGSNLRKIRQPGDTTTAAAGQKLNALQRMIMQGQQQQHAGQQQQQQEDQGTCGSRQDMPFDEQQQQQKQHMQQHRWAGRACRAVDVLDEGQYGGEITTAGDGFDSDDVTIVSETTSSPKEAAERCRQAQQQQQQQGLMVQEQLQGWQQWQQLSGPGDPICAGMQQMHQQLQESKQLDAPANKRAKLEVLSHTQHLQQHSTGGGTLHTADGWLKASQLPQQEQQHLPACDVVQQQSSMQQQLRPQPQHQQYDNHSAVQHGPPQQPVAFSSDGAAAASASAAGEATTSPVRQLGSGIREPHKSHVKPPGAVNKTKTLWTCLACTYSSNKAVMLRCEVCDTPKGDSSAPPVGWLCTKGSKGSNSKASSEAGSKVQRRQGSKQQFKRGGTKQMSLHKLKQ